VLLGATSLGLGLNGWEVSRLWFWFLGSALVLLVGVHLVLFWGLMRVLHTLDERPSHVGRDMTAAGVSQPPKGAGAVYGPSGSVVA
jgi:hypothetical protein